MTSTLLSDLLEPFYTDFLSYQKMDKHFCKWNKALKHTSYYGRHARVKSTTSCDICYPNLWLRKACFPHLAPQEQTTTLTARLTKGPLAPYICAI